jgi:hypothetical protein
METIEGLEYNPTYDPNLMASSSEMEHFCDFCICSALEIKRAFDSIGDI